MALSISMDKKTTILNKSLSVVPFPHLTGLNLYQDILLGSLALNTIDANNVAWICTDVQGWWDQPEPVFPDFERGWNDGSYDVRGKWSSRKITLTGTILTPDSSYVAAAKDTLIRATNLVYSGTWLVMDEGTAIKASYVRLDGKPTINTVNPRGRTEFSIPLKAADPIKYEWIDNSPDGYRASFVPQNGSVTITNTGNIKVPVLFEINGPLTASATTPATIKNTTRNETISIVKPISGIESMSIDTYTQEVAINNVVGASRDRLATYTQWIYLDPGDNVLTFTRPGGLATCTVFYRSGWIA